MSLEKAGGKDKKGKGGNTRRRTKPVRNGKPELGKGVKRWA